MSNPLAIAAVTATLRDLLLAGLRPDHSDIVVTTVAPDRARANGTNANQLNIFLYHALPNAAWRNQDLPQRVAAGETAMPPLAINLYYLITAYGRDDDRTRPFSHILLGKSMSILHDHAVLLVDEIKDALPDNDLYAEIERVRLTWQPLTLEEVSKLWSGFQTQYRLSVAYEASVVLIDSARRAKAGLPVLARGQDDGGIGVGPSLVPPFPEITDVVFPNKQSAAQLGDEIKLAGFNLANVTRAIFSSLRLQNPIVVAPKAGATDSEVVVSIDNAPAKWIAGPYTVSLEITENKGTPKERVRVTNELPIAIAPAITSAFPLPASFAAGAATIKLTATPRVRPEQRVALLVGDQEVPSDDRTTTTNQLTFSMKPAQPGTYFVRLRVDGVDSQLVDRSKPTPVFKDQKVTIT
jgi:Pvc16 N-terminal domain